MAWLNAQGVTFNYSNVRLDQGAPASGSGYWLVAPPLAPAAEPRTFTVAPPIANAN